MYKFNGKPIFTVFDFAILGLAFGSICAKIFESYLKKQTESNPDSESRFVDNTRFVDDNRQLLYEQSNLYSFLLIASVGADVDLRLVFIDELNAKQLRSREAIKKLIDELKKLFISESKPLSLAEKATLKAKDLQKSLTVYKGNSLPRFIRKGWWLFVNNLKDPINNDNLIEFFKQGFIELFRNVLANFAVKMLEVFMGQVTNPVQALIIGLVSGLLGSTLIIIYKVSLLTMLSTSFFAFIGVSVGQQKLLNILLELPSNFVTAIEDSSPLKYMDFPKQLPPKIVVDKKPGLRGPSLKSAHPNFSEFQKIPEFPAKLHDYVESLLNATRDYLSNPVIDAVIEEKLKN